eukprot:CAMPEP_0171300302 /NCGR_PEP_ID=MMETSP0816-20121228/9076_1 /TAXON_ID=420281 /ORGANISM="Proboscia inermis, Strain CCAP1064/1" /LENGTH=153 /DNA_ID=CAMNT_0011776679 /DNA_START=156 /DNA_END=617 /DNA_ORIENTATION=-
MERAEILTRIFRQAVELNQQHQQQPTAQPQLVRGDASETKETQPTKDAKPPPNGTPDPDSKHTQEHVDTDRLLQVIISLLQPSPASVTKNDGCNTISNINEELIYSLKSSAFPKLRSATSGTNEGRTKQRVGNIRKGHGAKSAKRRKRRSSRQ